VDVQILCIAPSHLTLPVTPCRCDLESRLSTRPTSTTLNLLHMCRDLLAHLVQPTVPATRTSRELEAMSVWALIR
jgi:hypothetical protein